MEGSSSGGSHILGGETDIKETKLKIEIVFVKDKESRDSTTHEG